MTVAPPKPPRVDELEALIKEARARQLRRRLAATAAVAIAAATALVGYSIVRGSGSSPATSESARPGAATFATSPACRHSSPRLVLSRNSGPAGTVVSVIGCGCPQPEGQRDGLFWFDTRSERMTGKRKLDVQARRIAVVRRSRTSATATFTVLPSSSRGRGMLDLWCGGANGGVGNAIGHFTVTG